MALALATLARAAYGQAPSTLEPAVAHADSLYRTQQYAAAIGAYAAVTREHPEVGAYWLRLGVSLHLAGGSRRVEARTAYHKAIDLGVGPNPMYNLGALDAVLGEPDSAFYWLNQAVNNGLASETTFANDSDLASLRVDPRYTQLIDHVRKAAQPCLTRPESRQFDYWVGDWDVTTASNQPAGKSSVQLLLGGCALLENWTSVTGFSGKSLNSYNSNLKMWQQFWTDQTGRVTEYRDGEFVNGSIRVTAHTYGKAGGLIRMTYTPIDKDLVRQWGEASSDSGKTWVTTFDFYYHRRAP